MSEIKGKVIAITGASSGIGEATALLLAQKGAHVVLGARRTDRFARMQSSWIVRSNSYFPHRWSGRCFLGL